MSETKLLPSWWNLPNVWSMYQYCQHAFAEGAVSFFFFSHAVIWRIFDFAPMKLPVPWRVERMKREGSLQEGDPHDSHSGLRPTDDSIHLKRRVVPRLRRPAPPKSGASRSLFTSYEWNMNGYGICVYGLAAWKVGWCIYQTTTCSQGNPLPFDASEKGIDLNEINRLVWPIERGFLLGLSILNYIV